MQQVSSYILMQNTIGQWLTAAAFIVGAFVASHILLWIIKHIIKKIVKRTPPKIDDIIVDAIEKPVAAVVMLIGLKLAFQQLLLPPRFYTFMARAYVMLMILGLTWFLSRLVSQIISEYVRPSVTDKLSGKLPGKRADKQMIPAIKRTVQTIIWGFGIVIALNNSGYDVKALVAGLGLGGLALALAAKDTVTNFFGGLTIFFDKPFRLGDRVRVNGYDGYIVAIGLRSFRLSTLEGTEVVIPSAVIIDNVIENVSREPSRRVVLELGLTYDTTPDQMRRAMEILHDIATQNPNVENNATVYFKTFADFSINISFIYFIIKGKDVFETQNEVNLAILERFNAEGFNFAFPTQSLYVEGVRGSIDVKSIKS